MIVTLPPWLLRESYAVTHASSSGPWVGPHMLRRLVEPALQSNLAAGMSPAQMIQTFRQTYLFTLGCSLTHSAYPAPLAS